MFDSRYENKNKTQDFMKCINNFDQLALDNIYSNRHKWGFTNNDTDAFSIDAIRDQYFPTIKPDFKGHHPTMKVWIRDIDKLPIYDDDKQPVQNKTIHKHYSCRAIIEFEGIQFRKDSVLGVWKVVVLKINKQQLVRQDKGYIFNDNSDFEYSSEEEEIDDKKEDESEEDEETKIKDREYAMKCNKEEIEKVKLNKKEAEKIDEENDDEDEDEDEETKIKDREYAMKCNKEEIEKAKLNKKEAGKIDEENDDDDEDEENDDDDEDEENDDDDKKKITVNAEDEACLSECSDNEEPTIEKEP
jgi:hypothetical protein